VHAAASDNSFICIQTCRADICNHLYVQISTAVNICIHTFRSIYAYTHCIVRYLERAATRALASVTGSTSAGSPSAPIPNHEDRRELEVVSFIPWRASVHFGIHIAVAIWRVHVVTSANSFICIHTCRTYICTHLHVHISLAVYICIHTFRYTDILVAT